MVGGMRGREEEAGEGGRGRGGEGERGEEMGEESQTIKSSPLSHLCQLQLCST